MISISHHRFRHTFLHRVVVPFILAGLILSSSPGKTDLDQANPVEVGEVRWSRDYKGALSRSRQTGKPLFLLFQEVPGCIGCRNFGQTVLTHPLLVEAIEEEFIPMLVYNNRSSGLDKELLTRFEEPGWNYQVIRFIDADQRDVIPRRDQVWDIGGVTRMRPIPG